VVTRLRSTFAAGRTRDVAWRLAQLDGIGWTVAEQEDNFAAALAADLGRPRVDSWLADHHRVGVRPQAPQALDAVEARRPAAVGAAPTYLDPDAVAVVTTRPGGDPGAGSPESAR